MLTQPNTHTGETGKLVPCQDVTNPLMSVIISLIDDKGEVHKQM